MITRRDPHSDPAPAQWNHACCWECWNRMKPDREPARMRGDDFFRCCFCGSTTSSGIFIRADPASTPCEGKPK